MKHLISLVLLLVLAFKTGFALAADRDDPSQAVEQLNIHPELAATLFASEPMVTNPASIDVDEKGRVWVCEAINYRAFNNADVIGDHQEGDRIIILEDTDGDAKADKTTVFYQGHDVDSAHGVMVMPTPTGKGTKAIVSALDSVFFLIDDDGDLHADRKELLFTGIGGVQHDHGIHAFHFGPDGKLYFNFGNAGERIKDRHGRPIIDKMGNEVSDSRQPYQQGMVFRSNLDGSELETLAWNFRNNWEVCVDSFGTMWQSDNDDDGNRSCRINYVMEYGNYGYVDELTGASWTQPRTNWEAETFQRHWHQNDPGVVPNLVDTGAGAPTGICVYEGDLLPVQLRGAVLHTDAGRNICQAYIPQPDGAGFRAEIVTLLDGERNKWFRPSDVCVAPDGSLIIADWYDPGVGGHRMEDIRLGRIFRVSPRGKAESEYKAAAIDVSTPEGAVVALKSPNMATRYLAWTALQQFGAQAEPALREMLNSANPVFQARAMWLLGKLGLKTPRPVPVRDRERGLERPSQDQSTAVVRDALREKNADLRVAGLRLARQLAPHLDFAALQDTGVIEDPSSAVRRELLIALHEVKPEALSTMNHGEALADTWAKLARQYDGNDRWYLEALGIAAADRWDACLAALGRDDGSDRRSAAADWKTSKAWRDILWRSRAKSTAEQIAAVIADPATPAEEVPRFFRALDFQSDQHVQRVLPTLAFGDHAGLPSERISLIRVESITRLHGLDLSQNARYRSVLEKVLDESAGTRRFVQFVDKFNVADRYGDLLTLAQSQPESQLAADALDVLFDKKQSELLRAALANDDAVSLEKTLTALTTAGDPRADGLLLTLLSDGERPLAARRLAVKALGASPSGAKKLLEMAEQHAHADQLREAIAAALGSARSPEVRKAAAAIFPLPPTKDSTPLPPLSELFEMSGDSERGKVAFNTVGTCAKCHQPNGDGKDVGPDLSAIGDKLARQAMFETILYPSAAISHNFETFVVITDEGLSHSGILVSATDSEVKLKDENGIVRTIPADAIEEQSKSDTSLMPADIQKLLTAQELVDIVEYMSTLKAKK
jgi:putative membrane-bound dehydrogenase-like protein